MHSRRFHLVVACLLAGGWQTAHVRAQDRQSVQLPTLSVFTVNTTVSVPDRGGMSIGGVGRRDSGRASRGGWPLGQRGMGVAAGAGGVWVGATILDLDALDRAVLAGAHPADEPRQQADALTPRLAAEGAGAAGPRSVAQIRRERAAQEATENERGHADLQRAQAALVAGKPGVARVYCRLALRRLTGDERAKADALWNALERAE